MSHTATLLLEDAALRPAARGRRRVRLLRWVLMGGGVIVVAAGALLYWLDGGRYASTDDAYVQADGLTLSTDVSGIVADIPVHEGETVKQGQVLFLLDPLKFQIALDNAEANLAQTRLNLEAMQADYQAALRDAAAKRAQVSGDQATYDRFAALAKQHAVTQQETDDARYKLATDQATLGASRMQARGQLARLAGKPGLPIEQMPAYRQAAAQVAEARRELAHSIVRAPYDGVVTQVNKLQPGMFLPAGTAAFGFISTQHVWIEAEPKETQLTWTRQGDHATVTIDAYPGRVWDGVVQSVAPATDQQFSLLPAENSSGNWVKVVQRLPVRVQIERHPGDLPLSAGMSATVDIDTGHTRSLADLF
ncbi:MAG TPA: HlyD family secretion protein [Acetobacteraceae bacterium]|nr:HlyD family secretion protein [Acetobacteraceae bacterium]